MTVEVMIEDPKWSTERHVLDGSTGEWTSYAFPHSSSPWPTHYGFTPGTLNPADGDELDVLVLSVADLGTGNSIFARAVGIRLRPDGDHKVIAVDVDDPMFGTISRFVDIPRAHVLTAEQWFKEWSELGRWEDEQRAAHEIERAHERAKSRSHA